MSRGRKPKATNQEMMEAVYHFFDFVQGVSLKEIRAGDISPSLAEAEWKKLSKGRSPQELSEVLHTALDYLKEHVSSEEKPTKKSQQILAVILAAVAKIDAFSTSEYSEGYDKLSSLKEYQALKDFALRTNREFKEGKKEFLDYIDVIKNDEYYELFSILKADGTKYYSNLLVEELKEGFDLALLEDADSSLAPVLSFNEMQDIDLQDFAAQCINRLKDPVNQFLKLSFSGQKGELALMLRKALMALMLTSSKKNSLLNIPAKSCIYYFKDFLHFLRQAISQSIFNELLRSKNRSREEEQMVRVACALCYHLYLRQPADHAKFSIIQDLIERGAKRVQKKEERENWIDALSQDLSFFRSELDHYVHGPLIKVWDYLQMLHEDVLFDPWQLGNYASELAKVDFGLRGEKGQLLRLPCPTLQSHINRAVIAPEFIGFLSFDPYHSHLLIDLNDPSSEYEKARFEALNEESAKGKYHEQLSYLNLTCGSEFYNQEGKYAGLKAAQQFIPAFNRLIDKNPFSFSKKLEGFRSAKEMKADLKWIHETLFQDKEMLSIKERRAFIDLFYLLLGLKSVLHLKPSSFSFTDKDGVDRAAVFEGLALYINAKAHKKSLSELLKSLYEIIFEVPMVTRERALGFKSSERLLFALRMLEPNVTAFLERLP